MNLSEVTELFLENNFHIALSSMNELLKILWTIRVNSCQCERSFSCLKRLKTYLRNSMGQERLLAIALLNIERNFEINLDQIVTDFIVKKDIRKIIF
jgi:hAT family C-terminal dimerisation region